MHSVLEEIEALDERILALPDADIESESALIDRRTKLSFRLLPSLKGSGEVEWARISEILANTKRIQMRIGLLRSKTAEEISLLERQDQLLHLLQPVSDEPHYMDYSA